MAWAFSMVPPFSNANGLVTEFSVMMRPLQAITALAAAIGTVNSATGQWDAEHPPGNWKETRNRWELFQGLRSGLLLIGFILLCLATALYA
jgi:hypothetical protein